MSSASSSAARRSAPNVPVQAADRHDHRVAQRDPVEQRDIGVTGGDVITITPGSYSRLAFRRSACV
jgi:hypothetical protein